MEIRHLPEEEKFILLDDEGTEVGYLMYHIENEGELRATHTKVYPQFEGKGYAKILVDALCDHCLEKSLKVVPVCSFVAQCFDNSPDRYSSVRK